MSDTTHLYTVQHINTRMSSVLVLHTTAGRFSYAQCLVLRHARVEPNVQRPNQPFGMQDRQWPIRKLQHLIPSIAPPPFPGPCTFPQSRNYCWRQELPKRRRCPKKFTISFKRAWPSFCPSPNFNSDRTLLAVSQVHRHACVPSQFIITLFLGIQKK